MTIKAVSDPLKAFIVRLGEIGELGVAISGRARNARVKWGSGRAAGDL
jgi:hypothetical protein